MEPVQRLEQEHPVAFRTLAERSRFGTSRGVAIRTISDSFDSAASYRRSTARRISRNSGRSHLTNHVIIRAFDPLQQHPRRARKPAGRGMGRRSRFEEETIAHPACAGIS